MHRLIEISPPDVLNLAWDNALKIFLTGGAAMSYCWSMRAARFEYDVRSVVKRRVTYLAHPTRSGRDGAVPMGGFLLGVPSNLPQHRIRQAVDAIKLMTSRDSTRAYVSGRLPISPNFSMSADPEMKATGPIASFAEKWAAKGMLQTWQRPAIPQFHSIETILGEEIHAALSGLKSDKAALEDATSRMRNVLGLMRERQVAA
jgi:multiple sugar transport system substrate-binding protein